MSCIIAIEGIDGSGKGTQTAALTKRLRETGISAERLQFPRYSGTMFGQAIADFLNGRFGALESVHPQLAAVLYAGDRFESRDMLQAAIDSSDVVILDRFTASNLAHQAARLEGEARSALMAWIEDIEHQVFELPRPDLTILLDVTTEWSCRLVSRKEARDYTAEAADIQESNRPYLERVRQCYLQIAASRDDWTVVQCLTEDGALRTVEDICGELLIRATPLLQNRLNCDPAFP